MRAKLGRVLPFVLAAVLCAIAFAKAWSVTHDLDWPAFDTQYREMAAAQTLIDDHLLADSSYKGEAAWYSPASGWLLAAGQKVSGVPLRELIPRSGPYVNLAAPVFLFLLVAAVVGPWSALATTAAFIFVTGNGFHFHDAATYSPWFAPENYGQGFFYLALLLADRVYGRESTLAGHAALGAMLGAIFLVHLAPALILGLVLLLLTVRSTRIWKSYVTPFGYLAVTLGTAFLLSLHMAWIEFGRYGMLVLNPYPSVSPNPIWGSNLLLLRRLLFDTPLLIAVLGFALYFRRVRRTGRAFVIEAWGAATLLLLGYHYACILAGRVGVDLPVLIPGHHYLFHLTALVSVGFGLAVSEVVRRLAGRFPQLEPVAVRGFAVAAITAVVVGLAWSSWSKRADFTEFRGRAAEFERTIPSSLVAWIRDHADPGDVFLCTDDLSLYVVSPAGRKVVATNKYFSSPFVNWNERDRDRDAMYAALARADLETFGTLAERYDVRYVIAFEKMDEFLRSVSGVSLGSIPELRPARLESLPGFEKVFEGDGRAVFRY